MYIGEVSKTTGASIKAIRFYEEIGLLNDVQRLGKYRVYDQHHVVLIELILKAKSLGFRLSEMKGFADQQDNHSPWERILHLITQRVDQVDVELIELKRQQEALLNYKNSIENCLAENPNCTVDNIDLDSPP